MTDREQEMWEDLKTNSETTQGLIRRVKKMSKAARLDFVSAYRKWYDIFYWTAMTAQPRFGIEMKAGSRWVTPNPSGITVTFRNGEQMDVWYLGVLVLGLETL